MACTATAAVLSDLLQTKFVVMANVGAKDVKRKSIVSHMGPMSIPEELAEHIVFITGLSAFPEPRPVHARPARAVDAGADYVVSNHVLCILGCVCLFLCVGVGGWGLVRCDSFTPVTACHVPCLPHPPPPPLPPYTPSGTWCGVQVVPETITKLYQTAGATGSQSSTQGVGTCARMATARVVCVCPPRARTQSLWSPGAPLQASSRTSPRMTPLT
jgi:hypothetical protein